MAKEEKKLNYEDFFKMAILRLRNTSKSRGIHCVFSGFNLAFREYYGEDPIKVTQELASNGKIEIRPVKRGVMIYLSGEAPKSRDDLGKKALSKILNEPSEHGKDLTEEALSEVAPEGTKTFPEDFLEGCVDDEEMLEIVVPGTPLQIDPNFQTIVISPKRHFRCEVKNPSEAKYIIYANKTGQKKIKIPKDNRAVFKTVTNYEKYIKDLKQKLFEKFLELTYDETESETLTRQTIQKLNIKI